MISYCFIRALTTDYDTHYIKERDTGSSGNQSILVSVGWEVSEMIEEGG